MKKITESDTNTPASLGSKTKGLRDTNVSRFQTVAGSSMAYDTDGAQNSTNYCQTSNSPDPHFFSTTLKNQIR